MLFSIRDKQLVLALQVVYLVTQSRDLIRHQVLLVDGAFLEDIVLCLELNVQALSLV